MYIFFHILSFFSFFLNCSTKSVFEIAFISDKPSISGISIEVYSLALFIGDKDLLYVFSFYLYMQPNRLCRHNCLLTRQQQKLFVCYQVPGLDQLP